MVSLGSLVADLRPYAEYLDRSVLSSGLSGRFTSTLRSRSEQERLYRRYLSGGSAFPAAPPGFSAHEYGEAFDYVVSPYEYQGDVGAFWQSLGGTWGASRDPVHFELPGATERAKQRGAGELEDSQARGDKPPWYLEAVRDTLTVGPWWTSFLPIDLSAANVLQKGASLLHNPMCRIFGGNWC